MSKERPIISASKSVIEPITAKQTIASEKLIAAAKAKNIDELKEAIQAGALIDYKDKEGKNAFTHAYEQGFATGVEEIIKATSFDVNIRMPNGMPLLIWSIENNNITFATQLINDPTVEVNARTQYGWTALIRASYYDSTEVAIELLKRPDIDVNARTQYGWTALMMAAQQKKTEVAIGLLKRPDIDVEARDVDGRTAFMMAASSGSTEVVVELLKRPDTEVEARDKYGRTAFMLAASNGRTKVVVELLKRPDTEVEARDKDGWTALMMAASNGRTKVVVELLKHPDIYVNPWKNHPTASVPQAANSRNHHDIFDELIFQGLKLNWRDSALYHYSPFSLIDRLARELMKQNTLYSVVSLLKQFNQAIIDKDITTLKQIIEIKPRIVNAKIEGKESALHYAINHGLKDVAVTLINHGAELDRRTKNDRDTPLILACAKNQEKVVEAILQRDNNCINEVNRHGKNALDVAGSEKICLMLKEKGAKYHSERKIEASKDKEPKETAVRYAETIAREREGDGVRRRLLGRG